MNKIKSIPMFLLAVAFFSGTVVHAESNKHSRAKGMVQEAVSIQSKGRIEPAGIPQTRALPGPRQGYRLVADVIGASGGKSGSSNYRIPVNSGAEPSAGGQSESVSYRLRAGYVQATQVSRGDVNGDGIINVGDVVYLVNYLYKSGGEPVPVEAGDITCDGIINVGDVVYLVNYLYRGGDPPAC
jgi:hypothetical protein